MTTGLWAVIGGLGTAAVLLVVVVLYGRKAESVGRAEQRAEEAEGDAEKRAQVARIQARRLRRDESLWRLKRLRDRLRRGSG